MAHQPVIPYLTVKGASDAIAFYQSAFDAKEDMRMPTEDGKRLMHASLTIKGGTVFLSDPFPEHGGCTVPEEGQQVPMAVALALADPADVDATFKQAVVAGAKGTQEPTDAFWGDRFAMLLDPYGHRWLLSAPLAKA